MRTIQMRIVSFVIVVSLACWALAQNTGTAPKVSDQYGKAAFLALKAIERDTSTTGAKSTHEAIDLADAEAVSDEEKAVTKSLNHIFADHIINNLGREVEYQASMNQAALSGRVSKLEDNPKLKATGDRETACFRPFEEALRSRSAQIPDACKSLLEQEKDK
jgi:hypothetical protein